MENIVFSRNFWTLFDILQTLCDIELWLTENWSRSYSFLFGFFWHPLRFFKNLQMFSSKLEHILNNVCSFFSQFLLLSEIFRTHLMELHGEWSRLGWLITFYAYFKIKSQIDIAMWSWHFCECDFSLDRAPFLKLPNHLRRKLFFFTILYAMEYGDLVNMIENLFFGLKITKMWFTMKKLLKWHDLGLKCISLKMCSIEKKTNDYFRWKFEATNKQSVTFSTQWKKNS